MEVARQKTGQSSPYDLDKYFFVLLPEPWSAYSWQEYVPPQAEQRDFLMPGGLHRPHEAVPVVVVPVKKWQEPVTMVEYSASHAEWLPVVVATASHVERPGPVHQLEQ
jgi:hypothetical protein